ncbi:glycoprotein [Drosophila obscura sigmavirus 10A]|uniref:Glycoprotein n=1 Tax=Drosophila obscura sigmavirus TaxID=948741 RepID=C8CJF0_9RHAB|nr:glycoprotein [Drosophila obscura sigmavirus 10A]ACU65443.1 glycoprotein [Drosophila obscura sigmavirus 10A]
MKKTTEFTWPLKMYSSKFLLVTLSILVPRVISLFLPDYNPELFKPAVIHKLTCPNLSATSQINKYASMDTIYVNLGRPKPNFKVTVEGYLCTKIVLQTVCEAFLFSANEVNHIRKEAPIDKSECDSAIYRFIKGDVIDETFLPDYFSGYKRTVRQRIYIKVITHEVSYDPYLEKYVDSWFPGGATPYNYSTTIHDSTLWKMKGQKPPCTDFETINGEYTVLPDPKDLEHPLRFIWALGIKEKSYKNSCVVKFCGRPGILFEDGEWFSISTPESPTNYDVFITNLPACNSSASIKTRTVEQEMDAEFSNEYQLNLRFWCMEVLQGLTSGSILPQYKLAFLTQNSPGLGNVYKILNGTLMVTVGHYKKVKLNQLDSLHEIGADDAGNPVYVTDTQLTPGPIPDSYEWINGLVFSDKRWSIPLVDLVRNNLDNLLTMPLKLQAIEHSAASFMSASSSHLIEGDVITQYGGPTSKHDNWFVNYTTKSWEWLHWIVYIGVIVGGIFVLIILEKLGCYKIVYYLLKKLCQSKSSKKTKQPKVEYKKASSNQAQQIESRHEVIPQEDSVIVSLDRFDW